MIDFEKLRRAARMIEEVAGGLQTGTVECEHCGHVGSVNQDQRTQWEMLNAACRRVREVANWAERNQKEGG